MLWLAALVATAPPPATPHVQRQARATVRIISGSVAAHFGEIEAREPGRLRSTMVRSPDGKHQPARLLEFE